MTQLTRRSQTRPIRNLQREVDTIFDRFFGRQSSEEGGRSAVWAPQTDLSETEEAFHIRLDVPGMKTEDINIALQDNTLTISGTRESEQTEEGEDYVRVERAFGNFHRTFTLPRAVDEENIEAHYDKGVLSIHVPKTEESTPRQIEIQ